MTTIEYEKKRKKKKIGFNISAVDTHNCVYTHSCLATQQSSFFFLQKKNIIKQNEKNKEVNERLADNHHQSRS